MAPPLVSICIPTFNRSRSLQVAIDSALAQTYEPIEIVVVDDASEDDTVARLNRIADDRIRISSNGRNLGQSANRNRTLALARGELIKFLDSDDALDRACVEKMVSPFLRDPEVALVFARRRVSFEHGADRDEQWLSRYGRVERHFSAISEINDGRAMLREWLEAGLHDNWIGEPSCVMVRRSHLDQAGGFSTHVSLRVDTDLWVRLMSVGRVGFIDEELVTYQRSGVSATAENACSRRDWLDRLWTLETLASRMDGGSDREVVLGLLHAERRQAWRTAARLGRVAQGRRVPLQPYLAYAKHRASWRLGLNRGL
jgi:glycosyltransferase involved in cell wall biosynthesis